jgi:hypothetical protein
MNQSNQVNRIALAAVAIAIGSIVTGAVAMLAPGASAPGYAAESKEPVSEPFVYFPAQYVNQATEIEPAPPTF